jgi:hypothetical protein
MRIAERIAPSTALQSSILAVAASLFLASAAVPHPAAAQESTMPPAEPTSSASASDTESTPTYDEPLSVWNAHRVVRVIRDGSRVVLGDGTVWEIYLPDRPSVDTWRRGDLLIVRPRSIIQADYYLYDYSLIDGRTRGEIAARLLGAVREHR